WKVINNILGLPFEEPEETYSTSAHLYHDQGIEPGTKGRLNEAPAVSAPARTREARPVRSRPDRAAGEAKPRTSRTRRRLKNGVAVEDNGVQAPDHAGQAQPEQSNGRGSHDRRPADGVHGVPSESSPASADGQTSGTGDGTGPKRRRRRRSSGGSASAAAAADSVPATGH
ncbi:MAG TPA: hypothetical protein VF642_11140, partial [Propionibacteriaceae bacterium]